MYYVVANFSIKSDSSREIYCNTFDRICLRYYYEQQEYVAQLVWRVCCSKVSFSIVSQGRNDTNYSEVATKN